MDTEHTTHLCTLETAVGKAEACPEAACPFWEPGGVALAGRCAFEQLDVAANSALATWLLEIRERLASAESTAARDAAHSLFCHLLNESAE
jgi:hypothetical protein